MFFKMTIKDALKKSIELLEKNSIDESTLKAKIILANLLSKPKEYLFINENEDLDERVEQEFLKKIDKLCNNIPLQYLTNVQEFYGLDFYVDENVLIPRGDTEVLVEEVIKSVKDVKRNIKILDMCTGSGIIAITLSKFCKNVDVTAVDKSENVLNVAIKNAKKHGIYEKIKFIKSNMFENLKGRYDVIVSNPPYIESDVINTLTKDVQNEPKMALDGGKDGLDFYRNIFNNTDKFLAKNGQIFLEIGYNQKESVSKIFEEKFKDIKCIKDLSGIDRVIVVNSNL